MTALASLLLLAGLYLLILLSPGPNFFILTQLALEGRRPEATRVVLGISTGSIVWATVALTGAAALLAHSPVLATAVRVAGAAYLLWYGARLLKSALSRTAASVAVPEQTVASRGSWAAYRTGLLTGLTNPKAAVWYTSVFAAVFPVQPPLWLYPATVLMIWTLSLGWHLGLVWLFASRPLRLAYLRIERAIKGLSGAALVVVGLQRMVAR